MATSTATQQARPRALVIKNEIKNISKIAATATTSSSSLTAQESTDPPLAGPGDVQLINYYKPALEGGVYTINIGQSIHVPAGAYAASTNNINSVPDNPGPQEFEVVAPRFSIDPSDVHSTYPPQGHADQPMILPHVVFTDPHLPWERSVSIAESFSDDDVMPWLAVMPFDINGPGNDQELRLTADQLNGPTAVYTPTDGSLVTQSTTCTVGMPLSQYFQLGATTPSGGTRVIVPPFNTDLDWANMKNDTTPVQVVFMTGSLFNGLFTSRNEPSKLDTSQYRYCAHVRNINTQGMADAGVEDTGLFSVIHSLRTGPTDIAQNTAPRTQAVHLLNLEYIEQTATPGANDLVALISLYSWTYLCQPPLSVNFVDAMRNIGDQIKSQSFMLRYSDAALNQLLNNAGQGVFRNVTDTTEASTIQSLMTERFTNGYALVRHRSAPGQPTVAFTRSPLVPIVVTRPQSLPAFSTNGQDYQILDQRVGILDISYSTAFQLGRTLASSDMGFVAALMRIRGDVHTAGAADADNAVADPLVTTATKAAVLNALPATASKIVQLSKASSSSAIPGLKDRWSQARKQVANGARDLNDPTWKSAYVKGVQKRLLFLSSAAPAAAPVSSENNRNAVAEPVSTLMSTSKTATAARSTNTTHYNELNSPVSTDWAFLFNWIMDKLFLDNIPTQYLITDPAHLPTETIRFFHIDPTWLDCLVDGALSVANHLASDDDIVRQSIKTVINNYLSSTLGSGPTEHLPQVPLYGFFLRSAVVKVFPDLQISIPYPSGNVAGLAPILVQKRMASDILMVLLDRLPDGGNISTIRLTQPVHQQCFSAGDSLDSQKIEFLFRKVYRTPGSQAAATDALHEFGEPHTWSISDTSSKAYDWASRCLNLATIEAELFNSPDGLIAEMPSEWGPPVQPLLTSSMTGIQLNDTIKYLEILPNLTVNTSPSGISIPRQIYVDSLPAAVASESPTTLSSISRTQAIAADARVATQKNSATLPMTSQILPASLSSSPAKIQTRSLASTPSHLNSITRAKNIVNVDAKTSTATTSGGNSSSEKSTPSAVQATSGMAAGSITGLLGGPPNTGPLGSSSTGSQGSVPIIVSPPLPQLPQFQYAIYPSTFVYTRSILPTRFVNTTNPYPPDIIFSINLNAFPTPINPLLQLHEIDIRIPIGDPSLRKNGITDILGGVGLVPVNSSPGSAARMLSNQRWIVHMDVQTAYLNLRVIPRTMNMTVPVAQNSTLSFKLNEVQIAGTDGKTITTGFAPVFVNIGITEKYGFYFDTARTKWIDQGSAQQIIALQRK
ncbi:MAG: hypothetical protein Q9195_005204 [Heterodermia aff. obscurata]